jgi:outer membrane lipoprotein-sorting protein
MVFEGSGQGASETKIFIKNGKTRMESNMSGRKSVLIKNDQKAYMYFPGNNSAMPISMDQANKSIPSSSQVNCTVIRQEMVEGRMCDVMECDVYGNRATQWFDKEICWAIKSESQGGKMYLKNLVVNANMDDSLFELPSGVRVMDMQNMMQSMKQQGQRSQQ